MLNTRCFQLSIVCSVLSAFMAVPCQAAPILLAEFKHYNVMAIEAPSPPPPTVPFDFEAGNAGMGEFLSWEDRYGPSDTGMTFLAPQDVVDDANLSIILPDAVFRLLTGPANNSDPLQLTTNTCGPQSCAQKFVPDLSQYRVTAVERTIDQLKFTDFQNGFYLLNGAQTVRFLGEPIPEPATIGVFVIGIAHCVLIAGRSRVRPDIAVLRK